MTMTPFQLSEHGKKSQLLATGFQLHLQLLLTHRAIRDDGEDVSILKVTITVYAIKLSHVKSRHVEELCLMFLAIPVHGEYVLHSDIAVVVLT